MSSFGRRPNNGSSAAGTTNSSTHAPLRRIPSAIGINRPSSALHNSTASHHSHSSSVTSPTLPTRRGTEIIDTHKPMRALAGSLSHPSTGPPSSSADAENNINVVVRVRGLSMPEITANEPLVAEVEGLRSPLVTLTNPSTTPTSSSATIPGLPSTKTYDFGTRVVAGKSEPVGNVFGPDADQVMLYNDVAKPILEQVMQGYNCTIFAYGQTGTGKTYTMEGDLSLTNGISISPSAGLIPRTLYSLFAKLSEEQAEFSVKCSFLELYNEELRDLNALDYVDPADMAPANPAAGQGGLKIYDDRTSGVLIQGLEETMITSAEQGLKVLKRGSERRQIAATKCNERSSRSHSIFTITVHIKENSARTNGEDLLKVGKLNLVDLAGSENVGRSGATNNRAREAGMINASLLTLGRVINKLVEKGPGGKNADKTHIPYRESKLTRLLQDSLGGRTKTTIIATISPVNFDDTISTLDYASKAKSIQNRPEINQRMSKNLLLGQYANEIERLKQDLIATRQQNGIHFSQESWDILSAEQEAARIGMVESKRQLELCEARVDAIRDQYEMTLRLVGTRDSELRDAAKVIDGVKDEVRSLVESLDQRTRELEDATLLSQATEASRKDWRGTAQTAVDHVSRLYEKVERKTRVEEENFVIVTKGEKALSASAKAVAKAVVAFETEQIAHVEKGKKRLAETIELGRNSTESKLSIIEESSASIDQRGQQALKMTIQMGHDATRYFGLIEGSREQLDEVLSRTQEELDVAKRERQALQEQVETMRKELSKVHSLADPARQLQKELAERLAEGGDRLTIDRARNLEHCAAQTSRLTTLSTLSANRLAEEEALDSQRSIEIVDRFARELATVLSTSYVKKFVGSLQAQVDAWTQERAALRFQSAGYVRSELEEVIVEAQEASNRHVKAVDATLETVELITRATQDRAKEAETAASEREVTLLELAEAIASDIDEYASGRETDASSHLAAMKSASESLTSIVSEFRSSASTSQAKLDSDINVVVNEARRAFANMAEDLVETHNSHSTELLSARNDLKHLASRASAFAETTSDTVSKIQRDIESYLTSSYGQDLPTGATPIRRQWQDERVPQLDGTPSRVIDRLRRAQREGVSFTALQNDYQHDETNDTEEDEALEDREQATGDEYRAPTPPSAEEISIVMEHVPDSPVTARPAKRAGITAVKHAAAPLAVVEDSNLRTSRSRRRA